MAAIIVRHLLDVTQSQGKSVICDVFQCLDLTFLSHIYNHSVGGRVEYSSHHVVYIFLDKDVLLDSFEVPLPVWSSNACQTGHAQ